MTEPRPSSAQHAPGPGWISWLALVLLLALAGLGVATLDPAPEPLGVDAPAEAFSAARAMQHVEALASRPRPTGSAAHAAARDYLLAELRAQGLEPRVGRSQLLRPAGFGGRLDLVVVENVLARLPGTRSGDAQAGQALMLVSHYDSVPSGPGAADDASSVAAMLETLRALRAGEPLANDVLFLFTDAEETGLRGAEAFVDSDPWASRVGAVLNFEARGRGGASRMFRTSPGNDWLIGQLARHAPTPVATSLSYEVFKRMPNDTDFSVFERAGMPGMDFAFIDGIAHYHSQLDRPEALDRATLQHQGSTMLALARGLGSADLAAARGDGDAVYFNPLGAWLVSYPVGWALPLALVALGGWIALFALGLRRDRLTASGTIRALGGGVLAAVVAAGGVYLAWRLASGLDGDLGWFLPGLGYGMDAYAWGFGLLAAGLAWLVARSLLAGTGDAGAVLGTSVIWLLLALLFSWTMPGVSYLFLWPALFALLFAGWAVLGPQATGEPRRARPGLATLAIAALAAAPVLLLLPPLFALLLGAMGLALAPALALLLALGFAVAVPLWRRADRLGSWPALLLLVAGLGVLLWSALTTVTGPGRPRTDSLFYALEAETGEAWWLSWDREVDEWTSRYLGDAPERSMPGLFAGWEPERGFLAASAPPLPLAPPRIELVGREEAADGYAITVRLSSQRRAEVMRLAVETLAAVERVVVNGRRHDYGLEPFVAEEDGSWLLHFIGGAGETFEVTLVLDQKQPVRFRLVDQSYGLPEIDGGIPSRPQGLMSRPFVPVTDASLVGVASYF